MVRKETTMRDLLLITCTAIFCGGIPLRAEVPMPAMPPDLVVIDQSKCTDDETGEKGYCVEFVAPTGDGWLVMTQNDQIMLIRHLFVDKPYEQVWTAAQYHSF